MGFFSHTSDSSLPQEILNAVHTMRDDLDGKTPTPQAVGTGSLPVSGSASPFVFSAAPAMKNMSPVNKNGLTSTITITGTDTSHAVPDPKDSSPFMQSSPESGNQTGEVPSPLALEVLPVSPTKPATPAPMKSFSSLDPMLAPISFSKEVSSNKASFVSENVTLGSDDPVYSQDAPVKKNKNLFLAGSILLSLALFAGLVFAYFFFVGKTPVAVPTAPIETGADIPAAEELTTAPGAGTDGPFTLSSPNYLPIDVETITPEQFRALLSAKEALLESNNLTDTAVEFFITDINNNPVAFVRFATLLGITLPQAVMDQIDESFSLYLYSDGNLARVGLALSLKSKDLLQRAVTKDESAIPFALQSLYLDPTVTKITAGAFRGGAYKSYSTRYFNIAPSGLSNDYTFTEKHWIIGTSANSFRKTLDTFGAAL